MGMNTACIIRNDFLHEIEKDVNFGKKVAEAVRYAGYSGKVPYHGQGFDVLPSSHADYVQVIVITANTIRRIGYGGTYLNGDEDILRNLAANMGYRIVKIKGRYAA